MIMLILCHVGKNLIGIISLSDDSSDPSFHSMSASASSSSASNESQLPEATLMAHQVTNPLLDADDFSLHGKEQIIEQDLSVITDKLDCQTDFDKLLLKPNLNEDQELTYQIMKIVNIKGLVATKSMWGGTVIAPGEIGVIEHNGNIEVAGRGRWRKLNWRSDWLGIYPLTQNIVVKTLSIIRVNKGEYGLARQGGKAVLLAEGLHCYNDRLFKWEKNVNADQEKIIHGTIDILRVPKGKYGLVQDNNVPKIIKSGFYVIDSNYFQYLGSVDMNASHINHQTIHVIRVTKFEIAKLIFNNKPMLLYEGNYLLNSPFLKYIGVEPIDSNVIKHSTITRIRVNNGQIALAWMNNNAMLIDKPKIYTVDNPNFIFEKFVSAQDKMIALGNSSTCDCLRW
jgi:hypothetical protein